MATTKAYAKGVSERCDAILHIHSIEAVFLCSACLCCTPAIYTTLQVSFELKASHSKANVQDRQLGEAEMSEVNAIVQDGLRVEGRVVRL